MTYIEEPLLPGPIDPDWWKQAVVYQIYPRSFADGNGDGIGDLAGIISRIPYLRELGVDAVWLCPFYPSPLNDGGYDVADYRDVDPRIGTLDEFRQLVTGLAEVNIRTIVDIVPNHSSSSHPWFQEAITSPTGSGARARYHFLDGKGENGELPPSDWESVFGGPAWSRTPDGQWYLHLYDKTQPDLNWANEEVHIDFEETVRFWANLGVAGFRVDVATGCAKDMTEKALSRPWKELRDLRLKMASAEGQWEDHPIFDRNDTLEIFSNWRKIMNEYNPPLTAVAEAFVSPERKRLYAAKSGLGQVFSFDLMFCNFDANEFQQVISRQIENNKLVNTGSTWVLSTHDVVRHASRYGLPSHTSFALQPFLRFYQPWLSSLGASMAFDQALGLRRARAASLMMMALPGSSYLYQGEELGLPEITGIPDDYIQDPRFFRSAGDDRGRDGCRIPLPWTATGGNFGFGNGKPAHLPQPDWMGDFSVTRQAGDRQSTLSLYRNALRLRRNLVVKDQDLQWLTFSIPRVMGFRRAGGWTVILNSSERDVELPGGEVLITSSPLFMGRLAPNATVWLRY